MSYNFTCIINGESIELDELSGDSTLSELCLYIQQKCGIPPSRQQIFGESGDLDLSRGYKTLDQLNLSQNAQFIILDTDPSAPLQMLPNLPKNKKLVNANNNKENVTDFDSWIWNNQLTEIIGLLTKHNMNSMDKISTRSKEFQSLLCDKDILISNCHNMIPKLLTAIQTYVVYYFKFLFNLSLHRLLNI